MAGELLFEVDVHERRSRIATELERLGARVESVRLPAGDYRASGGVLVERKRPRDLHLTLVEGRLWSQIGRLRSYAARPYLLVEGPNLDAGPVTPPAIRGALLAIAEQEVTVVRSFSAPDSALWLYRIGIRACRTSPPRDRPLYAQRPKRGTPQTAAEAMLAAIPDISTVSARALLSHFGSLTAVFAATADELAAAPGIGAVRASRLAAVLTHPHSGYRSRRSRER